MYLLAIYSLILKQTIIWEQYINNRKICQVWNLGQICQELFSVDQSILIRLIIKSAVMAGIKVKSGVSVLSILHKPTTVEILQQKPRLYNLEMLLSDM